MDEEKKKAAYKFLNEYQKSRYDRITILRTKGDKRKIAVIAAERGLTVTQFINQCIDEKLKRAGIEFDGGGKESQKSAPGSKNPKD